jgi:NTP pyrophosphatase (non-canonical NTP hydrolase)
MQASEYQKWCRRFDNHESDVNMLALSLGLCAEAGEVANEFERRCRKNAAPLDLDKVRKELGDVMWNVARIADELNMTLEEIMQHNINKLIARYAEEGIPTNE